MLKDTLSKFFKIDSLIENLTGLVETRVEILKIEVKEDLKKGLAQAIAYLFIFFVAALFLTFVSIGVALLAAERLGAVAGFSIVGGMYLAATLVLWFYRDRLIAKLETILAVKFRKKN